MAVAGHSSLGVEADLGPWGGYQGSRQAARVIVMAVAQHDEIRSGEIDPQGRGVTREGLALARVEEDPRVIGFDPQGEPVLGGEILPEAAVFHEHRDAEGADHVYSLRCTASPKRGVR